MFSAKYRWNENVMLVFMNNLFIYTKDVYTMSLTSIDEMKTSCSSRVCDLQALLKICNEVT